MSLYELVDKLCEYDPDDEAFISYGGSLVPLEAVFLVGENKIVVSDRYPSN